jgi:chromosome segregation ATPase
MTDPNVLVWKTSRDFWFGEVQWMQRFADKQTTKLAEANLKIEALEKRVREAESSGFYLQEADLWKRSYCSLQKRADELSKEASRLQRERNEAEAALDRARRELDDTESNLKLALAERDNWKVLLEKTQARVIEKVEQMEDLLSALEEIRDSVYWSQRGGWAYYLNKYNLGRWL